MGSFSITLILLFLLGGLVAVDYSGRSMTFDDKTPVAAVQRVGEDTYLNVKVFGIDKSYDVTPVADAVETFADFICFPDS